MQHDVHFQLDFQFVGRHKIPPADYSVVKLRKEIDAEYQNFKEEEQE